MTRWLISSLILPALVGTTLVMGGCGGQGAEPAQATETVAAERPAEKAALVRSARPEVRDVTDLAVLPAELEPRRRASLAAEVSGVVEKLTFEEGQAVGAGTVLVEVDTRSLQQAVAEAEALDRQARLQFTRAENLFEKRSITQSQLLDAVTNRDVAAARLASAKLQLDQSKVRAPWSGRVASKRAEVGDYLVPGQAVAELVDTRVLKVRAPASSADVPFLKVGAPVEISVDAFPGERFQGKVARLGAELDATARTLTLEAELDNRRGLLRPGLPARLEVPRRELPGAILIDTAAVVDLGDADVVYVIVDQRAQRRPVSLGPTQGDQVVILEGLTPEDLVIVDGAQEVADGQLVTESPGAGS